MANRNVLDVGALVATDDTMSKIEKAEKEMCKLEKSTEKSDNTANEQYKKMAKVLIGLVGANSKVVFLLKCIIFLVFLFGWLLLAKNW